MTKSLLDRCNELFVLDGDKLVRKTNQSPNAQIGDVAGWFDEGIGYYRVRIDNKSYLTHRIIYLMVNHYIPDLVDHIDNNPLNNFPENLREASKMQNRWNCKCNATNKSKVKGVYYDKGRWKALITVAGERVYLGMYATIEEAARVVDSEYKKRQGVFKNEI